MIFSCSKISKSFGTDTVLRDVSFNINDHEKAAIIGANGAGKSTLFKIITGELTPDSGIFNFAKNISVGYLAQYQEIESDNSIYEELLSGKADVLSIERELRLIEKNMKNVTGDELEEYMLRYSKLSHEYELRDGYALKSEVTGILKGLGFTEDEFGKNVRTLSGGEKTRIALGRLLLNKHDLLLLDEPINHLDLSAVVWLENYLRSYEGAVIIVAHDRYFLDRTVTKIIEIENNTSVVYTGNYTAYAAKKEQRRNEQIKAYIKQQQEIRHQQEVITKLRSFNREKSIKRAESREKVLDKMERVEKPFELNDRMRLTLTPYKVSGNDVLSCDSLSKAFNSQKLFSNVSFEIKKGEHVALIGQNGTGKTTLLKIINGITNPDSGSFSLGSNVEIGYYDQEQQELDPDKNLFEEISDSYPYLDNTEIRSTLAAYLFTGDDVYKKIRDLSGGEKGRLCLAKLMLSEANFLILDEPTNHLDMVSKDILGSALNRYEGTVLYVSHDRYFINTTASRILELTNNRVLNYIGNYDYYLEKRDAALAGAGITSGPATIVSSDTENKKDWQKRKLEQSQMRKKQAELARIEAEIDTLENRDREIDEILSDPLVACDLSKCLKFSKEKDEISQKIEELLPLWEQLQE